jgi:hypothetical protein
MKFGHETPKQAIDGNKSTNLLDYIKDPHAINCQKNHDELERRRFFSLNFLCIS